MLFFAFACCGSLSHIAFVAYFVQQPPRLLLRTVKHLPLCWCFCYFVISLDGASELSCAQCNDCCVACGPASSRTRTNHHIPRGACELTIVAPDRQTSAFTFVLCFLLFRVFFRWGFRAEAVLGVTTAVLCAGQHLHAQGSTSYIPSHFQVACDFFLVLLATVATSVGLMGALICINFFVSTIAVYTNEKRKSSKTRLLRKRRQGRPPRNSDAKTPLILISPTKTAKYHQLIAPQSVA